MNGPQRLQPGGGWNLLMQICWMWTDSANVTPTLSKFPGLYPIVSDRMSPGAYPIRSHHLLSYLHPGAFKWPKHAGFWTMGGTWRIQTILRNLKKNQFSIPIPTIHLTLQFKIFEEISTGTLYTHPRQYITADSKGKQDSYLETTKTYEYYIHIL